MSKVSCLRLDRCTYSFRCNLTLAEGLTPSTRPTTIGVTCMGGGRATHSCAWWPDARERGRFATFRAATRMVPR